MKIGMLAPISWTVPPAGYGPWEKVVYGITEGLIKLGHEVILFCANGSQTSAEMIFTSPYPLSLWDKNEMGVERKFDPKSGYLLGPPDFRVWEELHISTCIEMANEKNFDIVHSNLHVNALVYSKFLKCPMVSTLHGAAWVKATHPIFLKYKDNPFVSLSNAERTLLPELNYIDTVYNGINLDDFPYSEEKEDYLLFAGRISPEKGAAEAVQIALKTGRPLKIAGLIEDQHRDYFNQKIEPFIDGKKIEYLGLLNQSELKPVYRKASAVLFMINWCEPCSMVAIETQASGTPIIGTRFGCIPEIVIDGETGYLVDSIDEACISVSNLNKINPINCRNNAEKRFSELTMAKGYENVYKKILNS